MTGVYGSDVIVDLLAGQGVRVVAFNPGATFRGLHDSLVHDPQQRIRILLCTTEGIAVAAAHGYAKAAGRPMAVLVHDVVGLQLASMAIYNAWCDRVPVLLVGGTGPLSIPERRPWIDWIHTALVQGNLVRDFVKWDDQPADLASVPESLARAMATIVADPPGPAYVCLDTAIQEDEAQTPPRHVVTTVPSPPAPAPADLAWLAEQLRTSARPVLVTDYAGATAQGFADLAAVAELAAAPVVDAGARCNLATDHPLNASGMPEALAEADFVLGLDVEDLAGQLAGTVLHPDGGALRPRDGMTIAHATPQHLKLRSWAADYQRLVPAQRIITATAATTLASLRTELQRQPPPDRLLARRRGAWAGRREQVRAAWWEEARTAHAPGAVPSSRLAAELWSVLRAHPWTLVNGSLEGWERRLWDFTEAGQHLGWHGGGGLGYGLGASIGAALMLADERLCVDLQPDGDLLYTPSALWTLAHESLPLLVVVVNNRQYRNTVEHAVRMADCRGRDPERRYVGSSLADPPVDYAAMARSYGVWATGPVSAADQVVPAVVEAVEVVRSGRPALVDVLVPGA